MFLSLILKAATEGWLSPSFVNSISSEANGLGQHDNVQIFKEKTTSIIQEYFLSDNISEVVRSLEDLVAPDFNAVFIKRLITLAMDKKNCEKEMASVLLSSLYNEVIPIEDIVNGFVLLLVSVEDTTLDIHDVANELALFLTRVVIDDTLAPLNLDEISGQQSPNSRGNEIVHMAHAFLVACHAGERILKCWGGGTGWAAPLFVRRKFSLSDMSEGHCLSEEVSSLEHVIACRRRPAHVGVDLHVRYQGSSIARQLWLIHQTSENVLPLEDLLEAVV
eukprot:Gb_25672 [translate_table: standard]